jgi:uncharacterized membrane protein
MLSLRNFTRMFALALGSIGVLQLIFQQVLVGRPSSFLHDGAVQSALAYSSAAGLIIAAIQLWRERTTKWLFITMILFVFLFSGLSNLYVVASSFDYGVALTCLGKAITLGSALWLFYRLASSADTDTAFVLARMCTGVFLVIGGVQHFLFIDFVKFLVPRWIPFDQFWAYAAGVALIASGLSLILHVKVKWIAYGAGWMVFIWFLILHIPRGIAEPSANELTAIGESLAVSAVLFALSSLDNVKARQTLKHNSHSAQ